jgi:hypothetical protein
MDLRAEEKANRGNKRVLSEIDVSKWEITCRETCPREGKKRCDTGKATQLPVGKTPSRATKLKRKKERKRLRLIKKAQQPISKPGELPPRICYNCRQPGILPMSARTPDSRSPSSRSRTSDPLRATATRSQAFKWSKAN